VFNVSGEYFAYIFRVGYENSIVIPAEMNLKSTKEE
jgi:hypothetical protein